MKKLMTSKTTLFCLALLVAAGAVLVDTTTDAGTIAGNYVWITRAADDPGSIECDAQHAGTECVELCMTGGGGVIGMNKFCCLESWKIGGWDNPEECTHWVN